MSDDYTPSTDEMVRDARAIVSGVKHHMLSGEWFDRMIESVRAEERERIARNIEAAAAGAADTYFDGATYRDAVRIVREGA